MLCDSVLFVFSGNSGARRCPRSYMRPHLRNNGILPFWGFPFSWRSVWLPLQILMLMIITLVSLLLGHLTSCFKMIWKPLFQQLIWSLSRYIQASYFLSWLNVILCSFSPQKKKKWFCTHWNRLLYQNQYCLALGQTVKKSQCYFSLDVQLVESLNSICKAVPKYQRLQSAPFCTALVTRKTF